MARRSMNRTIPYPQFTYRVSVLFMTDRKGRRYSGLLTLIRQEGWLPDCEWQGMIKDALASFTAIVLSTVLAHV